jgi:hypothetical protein
MVKVTFGNSTFANRGIRLVTCQMFGMIVVVKDSWPVAFQFTACDHTLPYSRAPASIMHLTPENRVDQQSGGGQDAASFLQSDVLGDGFHTIIVCDHRRGQSDSLPDLEVR